MTTGTEIVSGGYRAGYTAALADARRIVETEDELHGDPPCVVLAAMERVGPVENARAATRATKKSILERLALLKD